MGYVGIILFTLFKCYKSTYTETITIILPSWCVAFYFTWILFFLEVLSIKQVIKLFCLFTLLDIKEFFAAYMFSLVSIVVCSGIIWTTDDYKNSNLLQFYTCDSIHFYLCLSEVKLFSLIITYQEPSLLRSYFALI